MGRIVITGASGHYGSLATDRLVALGRAADLTLVTRKPDKLAHRAAQGCDIRYGDFDEPESMIAAVAGAERMLLISGTRVGARVGQHRAAVDAAVAAGVRHLVYTSFINVDDSNPAIVRIDHAATEQIIRDSGLAWTFLRDAHYADAMVLMAGPGMIASGVWKTSTDGGREAMVWRDDCVDCAVAVLTGTGHEGCAYGITGPDLESFEDVAAMISAACGRVIRIERTDDAGMYAHFDALGIPRHPVDDQTVAGVPWNSDDMVSFERAIREGALAIRTNDVERLTGRPARSVQQLIDANIDFLRSHAT